MTDEAREAAETAARDGRAWLYKRDGGRLIASALVHVPPGISADEAEEILRQRLASLRPPGSAFPIGALGPLLY